MTTGTELHPDYVTGTWTLDLAHSELAFSVRHLAISKVKGFFRAFEVTVVTAENPYESTIEATIDVASVDTNNEMRDGHLKTSDFFLVEEYPTATFRSTKIEGTADAFAITGDLTLRGVTKEIVITGEFGGITTDGYGQTKIGATATTKINRLDFGVNWNAALEAGGLTLGDEVTLTFDIQLAKQA